MPIRIADEELLQAAQERLLALAVITSTSTLACSFLRRFTAIFAAGALTLTITHTRS